jgi:hypothetical protein
MNFPGRPAREENEQVKLIVADVFLCRLVIDLDTLNLVLIALRVCPKTSGGITKFSEHEAD